MDMAIARAGLAPGICFVQIPLGFKALSWILRQVFKALWIAQASPEAFPYSARPAAQKQSEKIL
jgi:hypothetical protein